MSVKELNTVPCFLFEQKDDGDSRIESPVMVKYYNGSISLEQGDNEIIIDDDFIKNFCKQVIKYHPEAVKFLGRK